VQHCTVTTNQSYVHSNERNMVLLESVPSLIWRRPDESGSQRLNLIGESEKRAM
jgi:hypothetical protein